MYDAWTSTFREMKSHMNKQEEAPSFTYNKQYSLPQSGIADAALDESEDLEVSRDQSRPNRLYKGICVNGMIRNRASRNAAANLGFQSLVAYGAKLAGWNLVKNGYADRLCNFVHKSLCTLKKVNCWEPQRTMPVVISSQALLGQNAPDGKVQRLGTCKRRAALPFRNGRMI